MGDISFAGIPSGEKSHYRIENENRYLQMTKSCLVKELEATRRSLGHVPQGAI